VGILTLNFRRLNAKADRGEKELEDSDVSEPEEPEIMEGIRPFYGQGTDVLCRRTINRDSDTPVKRVDDI
jgi:hypothetical protein